MSNLTTTNPTRERILDSAVDEFSRRGFAAARVDEIARSAKANKQLIYYYFGSKSGLYEAVLGEMIETFRPHWSALSGSSLADAVASQPEYVARADNAKWRRLLAWEGVEHGGQPDANIHLEAVRSEAYATQTHLVEEAQSAGDIPADVDARTLSLIFALAAVGPDALPQVTQLTTGKSSSDPDLRASIAHALKVIVASLAVYSATHDGGEDSATGG